MTSLEPRGPYTREELSRLYPASLELRQVQILLRHGERTPVSSRFKNAGLPANWPYCKAATAFRSIILDPDGNFDELDWRRRLESFGEDDVPQINTSVSGKVDAVCLPGELTDRGRETTRALGSRIRHLYVDQLKFLPEKLGEASAMSVNLRSTPIVRALESVQQAFTGVYPPAYREKGTQLPVIVTRTMPDETLFPNEGGCKRFAELARAFADRTAKLYNSGPELAYINRKIGKWMPKESPEVKVDSHPRLSGVMDTINATLAHGAETRLPKEFYDTKVRDGIDKICVEEWFIGYSESNEYRKLGIGAQIGDITQRMVEHARGKGFGTNQPDEGEFKLSLAGCHDTTIAAALASFGAFDPLKDKWPNFTSNIAFELFKRRDTDTQETGHAQGAIWPSKERTWWYSIFSSPKSQSTPARTPLVDQSDAERSQLDDYYVRLRYNDLPVNIPFCRAQGRHLDGDESFCTLAAFKEAADTFTPRNWKVECNANLGEPAIKHEVERPPGL